MTSPLYGQLPLGYKARVMRLVLTKDLSGWSFQLRSDEGYTVPLRRANGDMRQISIRSFFDTKVDAHLLAKRLDLPAYAVWNGHKRTYDGWNEAACVRVEERA